MKTSTDSVEPALSMHALAFERARMASLLDRMDALWPSMKAELAHSAPAASLIDSELYMQLSLWIGTIDGYGSQLARTGHITGPPDEVLSSLRAAAAREHPSIASGYTFAAEHLPATRELIDTLDLLRLLALEVLSARPGLCISECDRAG